MPKNKKKQESSSGSDSDDGPVDVSFIVDKLDNKLITALF